MKIITWNCNGAFRKKFEAILHFDADIHVIQECENPATTNDRAYKAWSENHLWVGDTKNKGLGIIAKKEIDLVKLKWPSVHQGIRVKHFLPCAVNGDFNLLAVWTHHNKASAYSYIGQFWKYLQANKNKMSNTVCIGDFNSNSIWDKPKRLWNHTHVVADLKKMGIESVYHKLRREEHGKEIQPTFYLHRNIEKPYHLDYCFLPATLWERNIQLELTPFENWSHWSDHLPLIIHVDDRKQA